MKNEILSLQLVMERDYMMLNEITKRENAILSPNWKTTFKTVELHMRVNATELCISFMF
jgi:hypothetical protein